MHQRIPFSPIWCRNEYEQLTRYTHHYGTDYRCLQQRIPLKSFVDHCNPATQEARATWYLPASRSAKNTFVS